MAGFRSCSEGTITTVQWIYQQQLQPVTNPAMKQLKLCLLVWIVASEQLWV